MKGKDRRELDGEAFTFLLDTIARLMDPEDGCPWDLAQTHASLRQTLLEESYEAIEALGGEEAPPVVEELGDLLINILLNAEIGRNAGTFTINEILSRAADKLVSRHPHIFGNIQIDSAEEVRIHWDKIKASEREKAGKATETILDGVPKSMPALAYSQAIQGRVARSGLMDNQPEKLETSAMDSMFPGVQSMLHEENIGDFLFWVVSIARRMGVDAEQALGESNRGMITTFNSLARSQRDIIHE